VSAPGTPPKFFIFTGPTLSAEIAGETLDAVYLPPVCQGDIYTAVRERPLAIGIIDGYFERVPAVWHKEILWAMSKGVHIFGSSSMGALRAAELHQFGMIGVGKIFEAYRDGTIEDDDEVVLVHGSSETGYLPGSVPLVNIRATLVAATNVFSNETQTALLDIARNLHYPERNYAAMLAEARKNRLPADEIDQFEVWLEAGKQDQKKIDALQMLDVMKNWASGRPSPKQVDYVFQHTDAWEQVRRLIDRRTLSTQTGADTFQADALLDELRLQGKEYQAQRLLALARTLSLELVQHEGFKVEPQLLRDTADAFRREKDLLQPEQISQWLQGQQINPDEFARLLGDEARIRHIQALVEDDVARHIPDHLRISGQYQHLSERARHKEQILSSRGLAIPSLSAVETSEDELWRWYFENQLGMDMPISIEQYALDFHFFSIDAFRQAVLREFCYLKYSADDKS
jgi:hypothetical protein